MAHVLISALIHGTMLAPPTYCLFLSFFNEDLRDSLEQRLFRLPSGMRPAGLLQRFPVALLTREDQAI